MSHQPPLSSENSVNMMHPVDERLRRISRIILPPTPYLLSVPNNYRVGEHQLNDWRRNSPFAGNEERLQYLAFLSHQNEDTIYRVVGDWDDGHGGIKPPQDKRSGTNSPMPGQTVKKKISLLDYKNKAGGQGPPKPSPTNANGPPQSTEKPMASEPAVNGQKAATPEKLPSLKRPISAVEEPHETQAQPHPRTSASPPPIKKARKSLKDSPVPDKAPAFLFTLPPRLSPLNLPADLQKALTRVGEASQTPSLKPSKSSKTSTTPTKSTRKEASKDSPQDVKRAPKKIVENGVVKAPSKANGAEQSAQNAVEEEASGADVETADPRPKLVVRLRIPKAIRKNCTRILNMQPRPQRSDHRPQAQYPSNKSLNDESELKLAGGNAKADSSNDKRNQARLDSKIPSYKSAEKRQRSEDGANADAERAKKRQKQPHSLDLSSKPHTPLRPPVVSPVLSQHGSAQKTHLSTPKRDLKSSAMRRIGSSEGDVKTPLGAIRGNTPTAQAPERINREARATSSASLNNVDTSNREKVAILKTEQTRYSALGRSLKHKARPLLHIENELRSDSPETKQGTALAFEALLSFMLSFALKDELSRIQGSLPDAFAWRTMLGYIGYLKSVTQPYGPLRALVHQLDGVCRDTINLWDSYRLDRDPFLNSLADDSRPPTANSKGQASPSGSDKADPKKEFLDFRTEHARNLREAHQSWQTGYSNLSVRELQRTFPKSWAKSAEVPGEGKLKEEIAPKKYMEGGYYLPLGPATSCAEAVRAGWKMLEEWCNNEGVKWEGKMGL